MDPAETSRESENQGWKKRADECSGDREFQRAPISPERKISEQQKWIRTEQPGKGDEQAGCILVLVFHRAHRRDHQHQDYHLGLRPEKIPADGIEGENQRAKQPRGVRIETVPANQQQVNPDREHHQVERSPNPECGGGREQRQRLEQEQQQGSVDAVNQRTGFKAKPVADRGEIARVGIESLAQCQRGVVVRDEIEPMSQRGQGE